MGGFGTRIVSGAAAFALLVSSAAGAASTPSSPAPQTQNGWVTLSMLTPNGAMGLAGSTAQPAPDTSPVRADVPTPPIPVIAIWLATLAMAIYILTRDHHGRFSFPRPISPG